MQQRKILSGHWIGCENRYIFDSASRNLGAGSGGFYALDSGDGNNTLRYGQISTITLDASEEGVRYTPVGAGIQIEETGINADGSTSSSILITQIRTEQAVFDQYNQIRVSGETVGTTDAPLYEDGWFASWNPLDPNKNQDYKTQTLLAYGDAQQGIAGLLDNDTWGNCNVQTQRNSAINQYPAVNDFFWSKTA